MGLKLTVESTIDKWIGNMVDDIQALSNSEERKQKSIQVFLWNVLIRYLKCEHRYIAQRKHNRDSKCNFRYFTRDVFIDRQYFCLPLAFPLQVQSSSNQRIHNNKYNGIEYKQRQKRITSGS